MLCSSTYLQVMQPVRTGVPHILYRWADLGFMMKSGGLGQGVLKGVK